MVPQWAISAAYYTCKCTRCTRSEHNNIRLYKGLSTSTKSRLV